MRTLHLTIDGITCGGCVAAIKKSLADLGVLSAEVDIKSGQAVITYADHISKDAITEAIEDAGFELV